MGESENQLENDEERNMATIKDIAARAGVTATTVSRVINNRGYISEETKDLEKVVGLQPDKPLKRAFMPYGGIKMAEQA